MAYFLSSAFCTSKHKYRLWCRCEFGTWQITTVSSCRIFRLSLSSLCSCECKSALIAKLKVPVSTLSSFSLDHPQLTSVRRKTVQRLLNILIPKIKFIWMTLVPSTLHRRNLKTEFSLWKRIKCLPSTLRRRNLKTLQSPVILDFCVWGSSVKEITWLTWRHRHLTSSTSSSSWRHLASERFRKATFLWRISVDDRPNGRNKAAFKNSSAVL